MTSVYKFLSANTYSFYNLQKKPYHPKIAIMLRNFLYKFFCDKKIFIFSKNNYKIFTGFYNKNEMGRKNLLSQKIIFLQQKEKERRKKVMKNLMNRVNYVIDGEDGASNVEIVVWVSVVLIIATVLYLFKDAIIGFLQRAITRVNNLGTGKQGAADDYYTPGV